jgi:hypothetical protein
MNEFVWGALAMSCWVVGLFFLRFWRSTRDRLFLFFCLAFWAFSLTWVGLAVLHPGMESRHYFYMFRLAAFVLIIAGIIDKNRRRPSS